MPIIVNGVGGTLWSTGTRKVITSVSAVVIAITGAITGVAKAAPIVEPWWYATRGYVRDLLTVAEKNASAATDKNTKLLQSLQLDGANGKREASVGRLAQLKIALGRATDGDKDAINYSIQQEQNTLDALDAQIKTLKAQTGN